MKQAALKAFLDAKTERYQQPGFMETDPVQVPHHFQERGDIEVAAFLTATIAWGNRKSIISNGLQMMDLMEGNPYDFVLNAPASELGRLEGFVHRTFNGTDLRCFVLGLRHLYREYGGMEPLFASYGSPDGLQEAISRVRSHFFEVPHPRRSEKHFSDPGRGSASKRINMFLRWMVRPAHTGVDFGIWKQLKPSQLSCPLDVHSGKVARALGLLSRKQNDARAVAELDAALRKLDPEDPVKYDFALFGLGVFEKFS